MKDARIPPVRPEPVEGPSPPISNSDRREKSKIHRRQPVRPGLVVTNPPQQP